MAKNQRYTNGALHIKVTAPRDVKSGDPVRVGAINGVAQIDAKAGEEVTIWLDQSWDIPVAGAVSQGGLVHITGAGALTATATGNFAWGVALATKGTGTADLEVRPLGYSTQTAAGA
ncbi:DUF2190 family protein [Pseudarthrobacter sp. PS3-L1]|uniref:DUF2190 family protein n=1 Tax=Pseudarthrobacter sp. PS3-L1 TaxID=3046207 RepID=UPI0024BAC03B|nr:DUF2190 family protein [Pseudarthrobacter sp. PS3-L1]MDJ0321837.1 DUF2190 family protein [Pseudarthrobacter sp. PS3-L1]